MSRLGHVMACALTLTLPADEWIAQLPALIDALEQSGSADHGGATAAARRGT